MTESSVPEFSGNVRGASVEAWARALIETTDLTSKLEPPPRPHRLAGVPVDGPVEPPPKRPGRPPELHVVERAPKSPRPGALVRPAERVKLVHTFLHHEVQAAELFAWALLRWPEAPRGFRRGLAALADEELRHARLYARHLEALGAAVGDVPVRDWFWQRVPDCESPAAFCALVGIGFEGGNLEHAHRFARAFRSAGDEDGARILEEVAVDEERHVRFARRWFERLAGPLDFDRWRRHLPDPLTPTVLRGRPLARAARRRAGLDDAFLDALDAWDPATSGS